jgi:hypothetical protein
MTETSAIRIQAVTVREEPSNMTDWRKQLRKTEVQPS